MFQGLVLPTHFEEEADHFLKEEKKAVCKITPYLQKEDCKTGLTLDPRLMVGKVFSIVCIIIHCWNYYQLLPMVGIITDYWCIITNGRQGRGEKEDINMLWLQHWPRQIFKLVILHSLVFQNFQSHIRGISNASDRLIKIQTDRDKAAIRLEGSVEPVLPVDITVMTGKSADQDLRG